MNVDFDINIDISIGDINIHVSKEKPEKEEPVLPGEPEENDKPITDETPQPDDGAVEEPDTNEDPTPIPDETDEPTPDEGETPRPDEGDAPEESENDGEDSDNRNKAGVLDNVGDDSDDTPVTPEEPTQPVPSREELQYTTAGLPGTPTKSEWKFVTSPAASLARDYTDVKQGQRLPDTATLTWVLGLAGAASLLGGSALALKDRKRK